MGSSNDYIVEYIVVLNFGTKAGLENGGNKYAEIRGSTVQRAGSGTYSVEEKALGRDHFNLLIHAPQEAEIPQAAL